MRKIKQCFLWMLLTAFGVFAASLFWIQKTQFAPGVSVSADAESRPIVYPCGFPIGVYLKTKGVMVIGTARVPDENGTMQEPASGSIESGDYILSINGEEIVSKEDFQEKLNHSGEHPVTLRIERGNGEQSRQFELSIQPVKNAQGEYRLGIWVKDDIQGIGTMTYITADGRFGALGHPISDTDTGKMVSAKSGGLYQAQVRMIIKGSDGNPGSFSGIICYDRSTCLGTIEKNTRCGIFGKADLARITADHQLEPCPIALKSEVTCGPALLCCTIDGERKDYQIEILNKNAGNESDKGFLFCVTDQELLEKTGGIIQGMSGSPIIQNGRLVGAVTHVFVKDSSKGYGIYIENMLEQ